MIDFKNIEGIYFVGIGGIGMSALALYFKAGGYTIAGYDRTHGMITQSLSDSGCEVSSEDDIKSLPDLFINPKFRENILVVYTPAIPAENKILSYFNEKAYKIFKRSVVLGEISELTETLAVAGTHGKTTVSTMIAHLLKQSQVDCSAFLGGISKNYNTNLLLGESKYSVIEADEYDRSFQQLTPTMAVITSLDADHLDIYGDYSTMVKAYNEFCKRIKSGGKLLLHRKILGKIVVPEGIVCLTYGTEADAHYRIFNIEHRNEYYSFCIKTPDTVLEDLHFALPGIINIENITAAIAIALQCGVSEEEIRKAVILFQGVRRRFDIRVNKPGITYIDDYAHHPEEIKAFITSVREYFNGRKITGIFQPHLFTRTRDHAEGFAASLDLLDEVFLLPIYPARENPIEGVSSELILNKMKSAKRKLVSKSDIPGKLDVKNLDVLITIGAGDIDTLVGIIEEKLGEEEIR